MSIFEWFSSKKPTTTSQRVQADDPTATFLDGLARGTVQIPEHPKLRTVLTEPARRESISPAPQQRKEELRPQLLQSASDDEIERLVKLFDWDLSGANHERAFQALSKLGVQAIPRLITALKGGTGRRFGSARTLAEIGINGSCGLIALDAQTKQSALQAVKDALDWERNNSGGPVEQQICSQLERAASNLSR